MKKLSDDIKINIYKLYNENKSACSISKILKISKPAILRTLKAKGFIFKSKSNGKKILLSDYEINNIIKFYVEDKFSPHKISKIMKYSETFIRNILLKNNIKLRTKSEGTSLGQIGLKKSENVKKRMSLAQKKYAESGLRKQTGGICQFYIISGLTCQGQYEKFYIEKIVNNQLEHIKNSKSIKTPYGSYTPDFENSDFFIEVKSDFTYDVLMGVKKYHFQKTLNTDQLEKIKWISKNIKPVKIVVIKNKKLGIYENIIL